MRVFHSFFPNLDLHPDTTGNGPQNGLKTEKNRWILDPSLKNLKESRGEFALTCSLWGWRRLVWSKLGCKLFSNWKSMTKLLKKRTIYFLSYLQAIENIKEKSWRTWCYLSRTRLKKTMQIRKIQDEAVFYWKSTGKLQKLPLLLLVQNETKEDNSECKVSTENPSYFDHDLSECHRIFVLMRCSQEICELLSNCALWHCIRCWFVESRDLYLKLYFYCKNRPSWGFHDLVIKRYVSFISRSWPGFGRFIRG